MRKIVGYIAGVVLAALVALAGWLILKQRIPDLELAYHYVTAQMWQDLSGQPSSDPNAPKNLAFRNILDLKRMLMSTDQAERVAAIQALGEKGDMSVFPQLAALLDDRSPLPEKTKTGEATFSDLSRAALLRMLERAVEREPANLSVLLPYFSTARNGSPAQQEAMRDILRSAREPLAIPLFQAVSQNENNPQATAQSHVAGAAIDRIKATEHYLNLRARIREIFVGAGIVGLALGILLLASLFRGRVDRLFGLRLMGLIILAGLMGILAVEVARGRADREAVAAALSSHNIMALRTANYHESTSYPGDSMVAQRIVQLGDLHTLQILKDWTSAEPDDFNFVKEMLTQRGDWIAARIVIARPRAELDAFLRNADAQTRKYLAELLGRLKVKTDEVKGALAALSHDEDPHVRQEAEKNLKKIDAYPQWPL
ncbi:MAG: hypothetical protein ACP5M0_15785 [Desulfomonilaceae bacterium]